MAREESEAADVYQRTLDYEQLPSHVHLVYSRLASIYLMQDKVTWATKKHEKQKKYVGLTSEKRMKARLYTCRPQVDSPDYVNQSQYRLKKKSLHSKGSSKSTCVYFVCFLFAIQ